MHTLSVTLQRHTLFVSLALLGALAALLLLAPAEQSLGNTVKLVYLHGALVRTAMALFALSLPVNLLAAARPASGWAGWGRALTGAAMLIWLAHVLFSMVTTRAAWGMLIAWHEPRTRFTFLLAGVLAVIAVVAYLVDEARFMALAFAVAALAALALLPQLGAIQHPLDPIGTSTSAAIRAAYAAILAVSLALGGLLSIWLHRRRFMGVGR